MDTPFFTIRLFITKWGGFLVWFVEFHVDNHTTWVVESYFHPPAGVSRFPFHLPCSHCLMFVGRECTMLTLNKGRPLRSNTLRRRWLWRLNLKPLLRLPPTPINKFGLMKRETPLGEGSRGHPPEEPRPAEPLNSISMHVFLAEVQGTYRHG